MTYLIIGHTEDSRHYDRCGDLVGESGEFETKFFRQEDKAAFLREWAHAVFHNTYETLTIVVNGVPVDHMTSEEYEEFEYGVEAEMNEVKKTIEAEHVAAEAKRKEAAANAAVEKARQIAAQERARDLAQLEALQRKLGVK